VTSVAYLPDDIITNDVMTRMTRPGLFYVYKEYWEDTYSPVPTLSTVLSTPRLYSCWLSPTLSSELPLQAERATPYLSTIVASEDLLNTIRLGLISILIGSCLAKALLNQTCSRRAQGPVKP
jgi:hypothetical protein